jgi:hypothetical protein
MPRPDASASHPRSTAPALGTLRFPAPCPAGVGPQKLPCAWLRPGSCRNCPRRADTNVTGRPCRNAGSITRPACRTASPIVPRALRPLFPVRSAGQTDAGSMVSANVAPASLRDTRHTSSMPGGRPAARLLTRGGQAARLGASVKVPRPLPERALQPLPDRALQPLPGRALQHLPGRAQHSGRT